MIGAGWYGLYCWFARSALIRFTLSPVSDESDPFIVGCSTASARESRISVVVTFVTSGSPARSRITPRVAGMVVVRSELEFTTAAEAL